MVRGVVMEHLWPSSATMESSSVRWPNHVSPWSSGDTIWPALSIARFSFKTHIRSPLQLKFFPTMLAASKISFSTVVKESARLVKSFSRAALFIWGVNFFKAGAL